MAAEILASVLLVVVGAIHLPPGVVAVSPRRMATAYGTSAEGLGADAALLLRHRAVLLALVGTGLIVGAFVEQVRWTAIVAGAVSMASFVVLAAVVGTRTLDTRTLRVMRTDVVALVLLGVAVLVLLVAT